MWHLVAQMDNDTGTMIGIGKLWKYHKSHSIVIGSLWQNRYVLGWDYWCNALGLGVAHFILRFKMITNPTFRQHEILHQYGKYYTQPTPTAFARAAEMCENAMCKQNVSGESAHCAHLALVHSFAPRSTPAIQAHILRPQVYRPDESQTKWVIHVIACYCLMCWYTI